MIFTETELQGAYIVEVHQVADRRGFFGRAWCSREFAEHGLQTTMVQANIAFSAKRGTLRGLHFQHKPFSEAKLVRCVRGAAYDVVVDLRPDSPSFLQWVGIELTQDNYQMIYAPEGCAHGYLTLADDTEMTYSVSQFYEPAAESGVRYDDPAFGIAWPEEIRVVSGKDRGWPLYAVRREQCGKPAGRVHV